MNFAPGLELHGNGIVQARCTGPPTFDGLESEIMDGVLRETTTRMLALTADSDFEEAAGCPISRSRRNVSMQQGVSGAAALRGPRQLDDR